MKKRKIKLRYDNILAFVIVAICLMVLIYSSFNIINWYISNKKNAEIKDELKESIVIEEVPIEDNDDEIKEEYIIDFKELKAKNNDTIGYIKVNNTNIDYVVVQGKDNSYYLKHNFNKEWNISGWIFGDYRNKFDGTDKNIIIYGHNTKDNSMFGTLKNVLNEEWYKNEDNQKIVYVDEKGTHYYKIVSIYTITKSEAFMSVEFNENEFKEFINSIKSRSIYNFNIEVEENDKLLTLSSCTPGGSGRVILHAKLID